MLNWLVIGIGDITRKRVLPAILAEPHSYLYALLTRDPRKADAYPGALALTDLGEALRDPQIDAVYVASPVALHAEQTIANRQHYLGAFASWCQDRGITQPAEVTKALWASTCISAVEIAARTAVSSSSGASAAKPDYERATNEAMDEVSLSHA